jgi:hypothetical protein
MEPETDITAVTDVKELKALAYDQLAMVEQCQQNLRVINERIAQLQQGSPMNGEGPPNREQRRAALKR